MAKFPFVTAIQDGVILDIYLQPNARQSQIAGMYDNRLKIQITSQPVDGKANKEMLRFIASTLKTPTSKIQILTGKKSRLKRLLVRNTSPALIDKILTSFYIIPTTQKSAKL